MKKTRTKGFPSEKQLRAEIELSLEATKNALFKTFGKKNVLGIYFKGSASRVWDSPIDYVPEMSDVDVHFLLRKKELFYQEFSKIENSLAFGKLIEKRFNSKIKKPIHFPMLQIQLLNELNEDKNYLPSLSSSVRTIHGQTYMGYSNNLTKDALLLRSKNEILGNSDVLGRMRKRIIPKYERNLSKWLHELSWRISTSAPSFLCMKGRSYEQAWSLNKSGVVKELKKINHAKLAKNYHDFYYYAYKYFLNHKPDDVRRALMAGYYALEEMVKEAQK